jgi:hypothetical protein
MMTIRLSVVDFHVLFDHQCMCSVVVTRFTRMFGRCTNQSGQWRSVRRNAVRAATMCGKCTKAARVVEVCHYKLLDT